MTRNESVSEYYDRLMLLKSDAQAALEDKYDNADLLLDALNDCALESFFVDFQMDFKEQWNAEIQIR